jgi:FkbM family methyltransferase
LEFLRKKTRLLFFLSRRIPRRGWAQFLRGLRHRPTAYTAMGLAGLLPPAAATIVDVGGHSGDVADALDFLYQPRRLVVIEPNPARTEQLRTRFAGRPQVTVVPVCVGETEGETAFFVHEYDAASSQYECQPGHLAKFGLSEKRTRLTVPMTTLQALLDREGIATVDLLKLDCQGAELAALRGAGARLRDVRTIYCEVSFEPIYAGAPLFGEVHRFLCEAGFELQHLGEFAGAGSSVQWGDALYQNLSAPIAASR